jgi:alpha-ketoglutaric semialdehyde dehydrogenase
LAIATIPETTAPELDGLIDAARAAAHDRRFRDAQRRAELLREISARLRGRGATIVSTAQSETGLPAGRLQGELERTCVQLEMLADVIDAGDHLDIIIDTPDPAARPVPRPDIRRMLVPLGPVAVFGASNFPLAFSTAGGDTASALAAGCPVVVKGHPAHPLTGGLVAEEISGAVRAQNLPEGAFGHALSGRIELGTELITDDRIEAVAFTGSTAGGLAIAAAAAGRPRPIPVFAEMGSVNPLVVTGRAAAARADQIAEGLTAAVATFGGQLCTKPGIVLVEDGEAGERLAQKVADSLLRQEPATLLTASIADAYTRETSALTRLAGVDCLTPRAELVDAGGFSAPPMAFIAPAGQLASHPAIGAEHFGPMVMFLRYADRDELSDALSRLGGQLTISVHAEPEEYDDLATVVDVASSLCGRVVFDGFPTGVVVCWSMQHGGPFPATTDSRFTSVGMTATRRFLRPVAYQNLPASLLPRELRDENPCGFSRRLNGVLEPGCRLRT